MLDYARQVDVVLPPFESLAKERQIELESSAISEETLAVINKLLRTDSCEIRFLGLSNTGIGKRLDKVANALGKNDRLEYLDLSFNGIDDSTLEEVLLPRLSQNHSLISVNLRGNDLKHRNLAAIEAILRRNQQIRAEVVASRLREQQAMVQEEISVHAHDKEIAELVAEVEGVHQRRISRMQKLRSFWTSEVAKAEAKELQLFSALQVEAEERKEARKGKKGKKGKK